MIAAARPARWSNLIIALHWTTGATILALIAIGWAMTYAGLDAARTFDLFQLHKSLGFTALALTVARLLARLAGRAPEPPPSPRWERLLAAFVQDALYLLTIVALISGWLAVSTSPLPIPSRFFNLFIVPNIAAPNPAAYSASALAHEIAAWSIAALVALHVIGAFKHYLVDHDDVLARMLPRSLKRWAKLPQSNVERDFSDP